MALKLHYYILPLLFSILLTSCDNKLVSAIKDNDLQEVQKLIGDSSLVKSIDSKGQTPLHIASATGNIMIVSQLLQSGTDINAVAENGQTPLHRAVSANRPDVVRLLVIHNALINIKDNNNNSPQEIAVKQNHRDIIQYFEKHFTQSLHTAIDRNDIKTVQALISQGADINAENPVTPGIQLFTPQKAPADLVFKQLKMMTGTNGLNCKQISPFHRAIRQGRTKIFNLLIKNNADIHATNRFKQTPLHYAAGWGQTEFIKSLLEKDADIHKTDIFGNTPLHLACTHNLQTVKTLTGKGANINTRNIFGETPIFFAAKSSKDVQIIDFLLSKGSSLKQRDKYKNSLLHAAVYHQNKLLLRHMLFKDIDVNAQNNDGETALFMAVAKSYQPLVTLLLINRAKVEIRNNQGKSPIDVASTKLIKNTLIRYR